MSSSSSQPHTSQRMLTHPHSPFFPQAPQWWHCISPTSCPCCSTTQPLWPQCCAPNGLRCHPPCLCHGRRRCCPCAAQPAMCTCKTRCCTCCWSWHGTTHNTCADDVLLCPLSWLVVVACPWCKRVVDVNSRRSEHTHTRVDLLGIHPPFSFCVFLKRLFDHNTHTCAKQPTRFHATHRCTFATG